MRFWRFSLPAHGISACFMFWSDSLELPSKPSTFAVDPLYTCPASSFFPFRCFMRSSIFFSCTSSSVIFEASLRPRKTVEALGNLCRLDPGPSPLFPLVSPVEVTLKTLHLRWFVLQLSMPQLGVYLSRPTLPPAPSGLWKVGAREAPEARGDPSKTFSKASPPASPYLSCLLLPGPWHICLFCVLVCFAGVCRGHFEKTLSMPQPDVLLVLCGSKNRLNNLSHSPLSFGLLEAPGGDAPGGS